MRSSTPRPERSNTSNTPHPLPKLSRELAQAVGLFALSALAFVWIFPAGGIWPATFICLVPWTIGVCVTHRAWIAHWLSFLTGWGVFLWALRWLYPVTDLGFVALAFYLAIYWVLAAWGVRTARRYGVLAIFALPIVWVACEYLRAWVMSGFPWLFLSHALYEQILLIQISDLTGAYGVTFVAAAINATIAELCIAQFWPAEVRRSTPRQLWLGVGATIALLVAVLIYGIVRTQPRSAPAREGPRVALVQEDFMLSNRGRLYDDRVIFASYLVVAAEAAQQNPDLLVMPETPWNTVQNVEFVTATVESLSDISPRYLMLARQFHEATAAFARGDYAAANQIIETMDRQRGNRSSAGLTPLPRIRFPNGPPTNLIVGAVALLQTGAVAPQQQVFNSALLYGRDGVQQRERYDKIHLVPFGEQVPFRYTRGLRWLYRWLNALSPFSGGGQREYSLTPGTEFRVFELAYDGRTARYGVPICYEDVMPYISRRFTWDGANRRADFLVNISNDGWFNHSSELPQHLAICAFRAVENRVTIARAVNTGISAVIDGDGRIVARVTKDGVSLGPGVIGFVAVQLPLDERHSFYGRFGDLFAQVCLVLSGAVWLQGIVTRWFLALRNRWRAWRRARTARLKGNSS